MIHFFWDKSILIQRCQACAQCNMKSIHVLNNHTCKGKKLKQREKDKLYGNPAVS